MENFRPGVLDRLGFTVARLHELNPRLVILSISGFGHDGPEGGRAGYDQIAQGEAGLMSLTGSGPDDPQRVGVPIGDLLAGMYGAYGVARRAARARAHRPRAGRAHLAAGRDRRRARLPGHPVHGGRRGAARRRATTTRRSAPTGCSAAATAPCRSRSAARDCGASSATASGSTRTRRGHGDQPPSGSRNRDAVIATVEAAFAAYDAAELLPRLAELGIPAGKVRTLDEVYAWDQTRSQGLLVDVDHPVARPGRRCPARRCASSPTPTRACRR